MASCLNVEVSKFDEYYISKLEYYKHSDTTFIAPEQNYELNQILNLKKKKDNLVELNISELNYSFNKGDKNEFLFIEKFKLQFYNGIPSLTQEEYEWISSHIEETNPHTSKQIYFYVELVKVLSRYYLFQNQKEKEWVTKLKGIHQLEKLKGNKLQKAKDEFYSDLAISVSRETDIKMYDKFLSFLTGKISNEFYNTFDGAIFRSYMMEEGLLGSAEDRLAFLKEATILASSPFQKMTVLLNLGYYHSDNDNADKANEYYKKALEEFKDQCHPHYFTTLLYLINNDEPSYIDTLSKYNKCPDAIIDRVDFLIPNYLHHKDYYISQDEHLIKVKLSRNKANKLFPGYSTLHLQNYFLHNYIAVLDIHIEKHENKNALVSEIINTCLDTRKRDQLRQEMQSTIGGQSSEQVRIQYLLKEINEFKDYYPEKIDKYDELFDLYLSTEETEKVYTPAKVDISELKNKLVDENSIVLNLVKSEYNYYYYLYDGEKIFINTINSDSLEISGKILYRSITELEPYDITKITQILSKIPIDKSKKLVVISDGIFTSLPINDLFPNSQITIYNDIEQFINAKDITLSTCALYSYSSQYSINDNSPKIFPELKYGLEEINKLTQTLTDISIDVQTTEYLHDSSYNKDLLHLSSHAYSSFENRLNNYFIYRDNSGNPMKKYGFELYEQKKLPKVVILSACETGIGLPAYGAGVQTLSRAFLDNGTQTVIKTLWKVNEKATAEFMIEMYTHWVTGISLYDALEKTKDNFEKHEEYSHPYYWAGFVLEGNPHVYLEQSENSNN